MVAAKNSRKRRAAWSPASATIAGTTTEASEILVALAAGLTVSWRVWSGLVSGMALCNITT
jgi:hypothetical protein